MLQRFLRVLPVAALLAFPTLTWAEPKAPTGLTATFTAPDAFSLDWDDTPGATEYWIFRVGGDPSTGEVSEDRNPIHYDKYAYQYSPYGYYSKFSTTNAFAPRWYYIGAANASAFGFNYDYRVYKSYSEYSYRHDSGGATYVGYRAYAPYGVFFVMAADGQGRASLPSAEAVAWKAADAPYYLKAPENVKVTPGPNNAYAVVSWDSVSGADLYRVLGKDSRGFNPTLPQHVVPVTGSQGPYWRYNTYLYAVYANYSRFIHYYGDVAANSYVVYSFYGAYLGYPLYDAYVPYGVYKVVAIKTNGDVWSPTSAESRVVPPGATDIAGSTGILTSTSDTLTISNVSTAVNGCSCTCPAGSLSANTVLTISVQSSGTAYNTVLPLGLVKQTDPIDFDIGSATVLPGQTVTITLPVPSGKSASAMRFYHWLNGAWTEETTGRVNGVGLVSVNVSSLSPFVLGDTTAGEDAVPHHHHSGIGVGGCFLGASRR